MITRRNDFPVFLFPILVVKIVIFRGGYAVCSIILAYETRLTENGIPLEPHLLSLSAVNLRTKLASTSNFFELLVRVDT